jgi:uncharacterized protein
MQQISDLQVVLASMQPTLCTGRYVFSTLPVDAVIDQNLIVASIREREGLSVVLAEPDALRLGLSAAFVAAWITLQVHSDLAVVGLTAAFSNALGQAGISCNVIAGVRHDHLFVPVHQAEQAMDVLHALQQSAAA